MFKATVKNVLFRNSKDGYAVIMAEVNGSDDSEITEKKVKLVGNNDMSDLNAGDHISVCDYRCTENHRYGKQYWVNSWVREVPETRSGAVSLMMEVDGIGEKKAKRVMNYFGSNDGLHVADCIRSKGLEVLKEVEGITDKEAEGIYEVFTSSEKWKDFIIQLKECGLNMIQIEEAFDMWGYYAVDIIYSNPYRTTELRGIGFVRADEIALKYFRVPYDSMFRVESGVIYVLENNFLRKGGHCNADINIVLDEVNKVLGVAITRISEVFDSMVNDGKLYFDKSTGKVFLPYVLRAEDETASKLCDLRYAEAKENFSVDAVLEGIEEFERVNDLDLNEEQKDAIAGLFNNNIMVLTGGPGTGKTLTVKGVVEVADYLGYDSNFDVALLAPTGRASRGLSEKTGISGYTIHRILGMSPDSPPDYNAENPLPYPIIIIDEFSMVDLFIANYLFDAIEEGTKVLIVGDKDQLPSVGPGLVLKDIIDNLDTVYLKHIYRQSEAPMIAHNAYLVNNGCMPDISKDYDDFMFREVADDMYVVRLIKDFFFWGVEKYGILETQVLSPVKGGSMGVHNLNRVLQNGYNPPSFNKEEYRRSGSDSNDIVIREGDKVMQTINNRSKKVFNGEIGIVKYFDHDDRNRSIMVVDFFGEEKNYYLNSSDIFELDLAYASTVHKAQGSEYCMTISVFHKKFYDGMLARNILYTAISRGKKKCLLVGMEEAIRKCVTNNATNERNTMLGTLLKQKMF